MSEIDHLHPDHSCPRCRDDQNSLRPDYVQPRRRPAERETADDTYRYQERW
jgi:hypothetical protein